jgi:hypothetical protein
MESVNCGMQLDFIFEQNLSIDIPLSSYLTANTNLIHKLYVKYNEKLCMYRA